MSVRSPIFYFRHADIKIEVLDATTFVTLVRGVNYTCNFGGIEVAKGNNNSSKKMVFHCIGRFTNVVGGWYHSLGLTHDGKVYSWGKNDCGQLGLGGGVGDKYSPQCIKELQNIVSISAGDDHSLALAYDGSVYSWGSNSRGQLGLGDGVEDKCTPQRIQSLSNISLISAGGRHNLALGKDGSVYSWGINSRGQLGLGEEAGTENYSSAQHISTLSGIKCVSAGSSHSIALTNEGKIYTWGYNANGELGLGDGAGVGNKTTPQLVTASLEGTGEKIANITTGYNHNLALTDKGCVYAWGNNGYGQLGLNNTITQTSLQLVADLKNIKHISAGEYYSLALGNDGSIYAWGSNSYGQLGLGLSDSTKYAPQIVTQGLDGKVASSVVTGSYHSFALTVDGLLYAWGQDAYGQLGLGGKTVMRESPIQVKQ